MNVIQEEGQGIIQDTTCSLLRKRNPLIQMYNYFAVKMRTLLILLVVIMMMIAYAASQNAGAALAYMYLMRNRGGGRNPFFQRFFPMYLLTDGFEF
ncbi:hypothetical protein FSP39_001642 [Pinctada imbricata]|uniref:Uncharacterized protein n=1 Tax=Pinctada imbricata TaxID=66713 RepID=A0AA89C9M1_PINIB|nr:hypothetical protein FSP39_001642 [Pinctada imbricata]